MNKLLKTIKENLEEVDKMWDNFYWYGWCDTEDDRKEFFEMRDNIKSYIIQSRIKELEVLVEMTKNKKKKPYKEVDVGTCREKLKLFKQEDFEYNQAIADIIKLLKDTIKELKSK